jgi:flagellar motor switch protein FliM
MSNSGEPDRPSPRALTQILQAKRSRLCDDAILTSMLLRYARKASDTLAEVSRLRLSFALEAVDQCSLQELSLSDDSVAVIASLSEGNGLAIARIDTSIVFRAVDAMFGGVQSGKIKIPERPLTALERSLACSICGALLRRLADHLGDLFSITIHSERYAQPDDLAQLQRSGDLLVLRLSVGECEGIVTLALAVAGLEQARNHSSFTAEEDLIVDSVWAGQIEKSVAAARLKFTAVAEGPDLLLGDIARLTVGSMIALDSDALRKVSLNCDEFPVFVGRLGQSRGCLTICLEGPQLTSRHAVE